MQVKFSEDVVPLSDLKINPGKVVNRADVGVCLVDFVAYEWVTYSGARSAL